MLFNPFGPELYLYELKLILIFFLVYLGVNMNI